MARDPNRIGPMLKALETYWRKNPDLRLGQLVSNMAVTVGVPLVCGLGDPYIEDDKMLKAIEEETWK